MKAFFTYLSLLSLLVLLSGCAESCSEKGNCPVTRDYEMFGGPLQTTVHLGVSHQGALSLSTNGDAQPLFTVAESASVSGPFDFYASLTQLRVKVDASTGTDALGESWLQQHSDGELLKLCAALSNSRADTALDLAFLISDWDFGQPQTSRIASGTHYILSASASGAEWMQLGRRAAVYLNDALLFSTRDELMPQTAPKTFSALSGDILRLHIEPDAVLLQTNAIWLHQPDGFGAKILHPIRTDGVTMPIELNFIVP